MFVGPVFTIELTTSGRRVRYFVWRVLYALLLLVIMVCIYLAVFGFAGADSIKAAALFANSFFYTFAVLQLSAVLLLGPAMTAGAIAQERERRTIEYLFTTHLTNAEIVLSKLSAAVVQLTTAVLVGLPVFALAMLLGGIDLEHLLAALLVTTSSIIAVVAMSLVASVLSRRAREAVAGAYIVLILLLLGPWLLNVLLRSFSIFAWVEAPLEAIDSVNPLIMLSQVLDADQSAGALADDRWWRLAGSISTHLVFTAVCVGWSAWSIRRAHMESGLASKIAAAFRPALQKLGRVSGVEAYLQQRTTRRSQRRRLWPPPLGSRPILWRELFARRSHSRMAFWGRIALWIGALAAILISGGMYYGSIVSSKPEQFIIFTFWIGTIVACCALLLIAAGASNAIAAERENETWVMLVSTPLEAGEIFLGKLLGSIYSARIALVPLVVLWVLAVVVEPRFVVALPFVLCGALVVAFSSGTVGLALSLWCNTSTRALGSTLGLGFGLMTITSCCYLLIFLNPIGLIGLLPAFVFYWSNERPELQWLSVVAAGFWLVGVLVHVGASALLWFVAVQNFDRLAGRSVIPLSGILPQAPDTPFAGSQPTAEVGAQR